MPRPKRQGIQDDRFEDPLSNYAPPSYEDRLQRNLCEDRITEVKHQPFTCVERGASIRSVMARMVELDIACVMIVADERLTGIFSERDVLDRVAERFDQIKDEPIETVMTPDPASVYVTDSPAKALAMMALGGFRHVPVLDLDEQIVGMIGPRRVNSYLYRRITE